MDVLNTYGGEAVTATAWYGWVAIVIALICIMCMLAWQNTNDHDVEYVFCFFYVIFVIILALCGKFEHETGEVTPIVHEVTLRPGHIIDATKYEIVEQRGQIYVIEERNNAE